MNGTRTTPPRGASRHARQAARAAAGQLGLVVLFQWAVVLGAPWGEFTQGGGTVGELSTAGRFVAAASSALLVTMGISILARAGLGSGAPLPRRVITVTSWLTTVYSGLAVVLNLVTPSAKERAVWAPTSTAILLLVVVVMLLTRSDGRASTQPGHRTVPTAVGCVWGAAGP